MNKKQIKQTLIDNITILEHYGVEKQIPVWIEEMSELTKVLCKWQRKKELNRELIANLNEEISDVIICLDQLRYYIGDNEKDMMDRYKAKVDRQIQRIEKEQNDMI